MEAENTATAVEQRAAAAAATSGHRYNPVTVANRIDTLEAEQRADQRRLDGHRRTLFTDAVGHKHEEITTPAASRYREQITARMAQRAEDITYWTQVRAQQIADGEATNYTRETISAGDLVRGRHADWYRVRRANPKSVTVEYPAYGGGTLKDTIKYAELTGHRPANNTAAQADTDDTEQAAG